MVLKGQRYDIRRAQWPGALPELQFYCTELDGVKCSEFILFQLAFGAVGMHTTYTTALQHWKYSKSFENRGMVSRIAAPPENAGGVRTATQTRC